MTRPDLEQLFREYLEQRDAAARYRIGSQTWCALIATARRINERYRAIDTQLGRIV